MAFSAARPNAAPTKRRPPSRTAAARRARNGKKRSAAPVKDVTHDVAKDGTPLGMQA